MIPSGEERQRGGEARRFVVMTSLGREEIWNHLDSLTKPVRSLGRLEELAARLCEVQQTLTPRTKPRRIVLFAADHGVAASGVTAWPSDVTRLMIQNIRSGGAASSVLARQTQTELVLIDVGSLGDEFADNGQLGGSSSEVRYRSRRVRRGTRDLSVEPALTVDEFEQAFRMGCEEARGAAALGVRVLAAGEMGIGNTTPAACLAMLLGDVPLAEAVGRGAGADDATLDRKRQVVELAVKQAREQWSKDPMAAITAVAGLEIAAMAGLFAEAHAAGLTILLDGYVAGVAGLVAEFRVPGAAQSMIAAHLSAEPGHRLVLQKLRLEPFLHWNLQLGEGTGALLLMPLLDSAAAITKEMARLQDLGIRRKTQP
jgi:nicotinate-nucleotide--dimethylbenzimidazole phosphoribosyltransferase